VKKSEKQVKKLKFPKKIMVKIKSNKMQLNYDYFTSPECKILKPKVQSNPRYKNFTQLYYTVGDVEQFWVANNLTTTNNLSSTNNDVNEAQLLKTNVFKDEEFVVSEKFKNVSEAQIEDTFNYIFHKFKKGIFIKIRNGQLESFIPFSKAFYTNEWYDLIKIDPKYGSIENFFKVHHDYSNKLNGTNYKFNPTKINFDPRYWYANNCILRYENPINEGETNYAQIKSMFLELCKDRQIPDIEFFVNKRDFPILTKNGTEAYNNIYGDNVPLKSYKFDKYTPILSMCTSDKFDDIPIPTHEDWARIKSSEGVFFPQKCRNYTFKFNTNWSTKYNVAVFRGSNTGCGYNTTNNIRLKLAKLGSNQSSQTPKLLDVGITNWSLRIRKNKDSQYLQIPDVENLKLINKLTPEEQSNYKYLINVDGHVSAFRLSLELSMNCCILMVDSAEKWKIWYTDMLEPYVHYVPVKSDLSDLLDQIRWCIKHDEKCKQIAQNALDFYRKYLTKKGVLDNLQFKLIKLSQNRVKVNFKDPLIFLSDMEHFVLKNNRVKEYKANGLFPTNVGRNYGSLRGLERFLTYSLRPENQITLTGVEVKTLFKSKNTKVVLYQVGGQYVVGKKSLKYMKKIENIHEAFIGKYVINNLLKSCPNFVFTLGYRDEPYITYLPEDEYVPQNYIFENNKENTILQEYIYGPTLQEFLKQCTIKSWMEIVLGLSCALIIAQTNYGFVHHDLKPWNIMVNILPEPIIIEYFLRSNNGSDTVYKLKTKYIPIIIDYGKSHVVYNNVHYGIIDPFTFDKQIDLITLLLSTINELVLRLNLPSNLSNSPNLSKDLIFVTNFLSATKINDLNELKTFLYRNKKFGNLNKEDINPISVKNSIFEEFFKYVSPLTKHYKISFGKGETTSNTWSSNPRQIADMGFALNLEDKINSYLEVVRRIYKNPLPQATNRFSTIMIAQQMYNGINIPRLEFIEFATQQNLNSEKVNEVLKEFNKMEKFLMDFYTKQLKQKTREPFSGLSNLSDEYKMVLNWMVKPTRKLFLSPTNVKDKVIQEMQNLPAQFPNYNYYKTSILEVLRNRGPFQMSKEDKEFYLGNFKLVFDEKYLSKVEDIETIRFFFNT
jgi:hypothetical protein